MTDFLFNTAPQTAGSMPLSQFLFDKESSLHVKRVVAVSGEEVSGSNGRIIVNGNPVEPPASACGTTAQAHSYEGSPDVVPQRVPPGRVFLVGDDMNNSYDSRYYGTVEVSRVRLEANTMRTEPPARFDK